MFYNLAPSTGLSYFKIRRLGFSLFQDARTEKPQFIEIRDWHLKHTEIFLNIRKSIPKFCLLNWKKNYIFNILPAFSIRKVILIVFKDPKAKFSRIAFYPT